MVDATQHTEPKAKGSQSTPHPYDDPDLGPLEFLLAVMRAEHLPLAVRIKAAASVAPYCVPRPGETRVYPCVPYHLTYIIPENRLLREGLGPAEPRTTDQNSFTEDPDIPSTGIHSQNPSGAQIAITQVGDDPGPLNLTTYSHPPSPAEIGEIRAAIHALRPDLAHYPITAPHLCRCGHWIFGPCPLGDRCRDRSKLN